MTSSTAQIVQVMSQMHDCTQQPRRFFRRDWKLNKPHLPKSTSLPILHLLPSDRPTFTCDRCGFMNTLIPLCLWCCWTSEAARLEFERSAPRARRASAPPRVFWQHKAHLTTRSMPSHMTTNSKAAHVFSGLDITRAEAEGTPLHGHNRSSSKPESGSEGDGRGNRRASNLNPRSLYTRTKVVNATSLTPAPVFEKPGPTKRRSNDSAILNYTLSNTFRYPPPPNLQTHNTSTTSHPSSNCGAQRPRAMSAIKTLSTKSLRSTHIVIDLQNLHNPYDPVKIDGPGPHPSSMSPEKTLRRKKRMSLRDSSTSSPSIHSVYESHIQAPPNCNCPQSPTNTQRSLPVHSSLTHSRSQSQPTNSVRLGHPSRPYYSAIRPNSMSRPSSAIDSAQSLAPPSSYPSRPLSLPPLTRAPSPGIFSVLSTTSFMSMPGEEVLSQVSPLSMTSPAFDPTRTLTFAGALSDHRSGFSLSGETELRMTLAREHAGVNGKSSDQYRYHDMGKPNHRTRMTNKVNRLKRGLKELVSWRGS